MSASQDGMSGGQRAGCMAVLLASVAIFVLCSAPLWRIAAAQCWPAAQGELLEAAVVDDGDSEAPYTLRVRYRYSVNGVVYSGRRLSPGGMLGHQSDGDELQSIEQYLRQQSPLLVHYNPRRVSQSAVYLGLKVWDVAIGLIGCCVLCAAAGLYGCVFAAGGRVRPGSAEEPLRGLERFGIVERNGCLYVRVSGRTWYMATLALVPAFFLAAFPTVIGGSALVSAVPTPANVVLLLPTLVAIVIALWLYLRASPVIRYAFDAGTGTICLLGRGTMHQVAAMSSVGEVRARVEVTKGSGDSGDTRHHLISIHCDGGAGEHVAEMRWAESSMPANVLALLAARIAKITGAKLSCELEGCES